MLLLLYIGCCTLPAAEVCPGVGFEWDDRARGEGRGEGGGGGGRGGGGEEGVG